MNSHSKASPTASSFYKSHKVRRDQNTLQGLRQNKPSWVEPERFLLTVMPEVYRGPERRVNVDGWQIARRLLEDREFPTQRKINADLSYPILSDRRLNFQGSFREIAKDVRLREDQ